MAESRDRRFESSEVRRTDVARGRAEREQRAQREPEHRTIQVHDELHMHRRAARPR